MFTKTQVPHIVRHRKQMKCMTELKRYISPLFIKLIQFDRHFESLRLNNIIFSFFSYSCIKS